MAPMAPAMHPGEENTAVASMTVANAADAAWQMNEGSICGLGQAAPLPLTSALKYFPEAFEEETSNEG